MRRDQIAADRQGFLVPCPDHPNILALVAPPTPRVLPYAPRQQAAFNTAQRAIGRLEGVMGNIPNVDFLTRTLARREAVQSSQIEGTRADLPALLTYEATHGLQGLPADVQVTERYVQALTHGLAAVRSAPNGRRAISLDLVNELHALLMHDAPERFPKGRYRDSQVWIGSGRIEDATFVPAPPAHLMDCMLEFESSILQYMPAADEQGALSVLAQIAIAHAQYETIHPYEDGNGRTGRLLMPLILAAEGFPPLYLSGVLLRYQSAYYSALASVQLQGNWSPWLELLARAVTEACDDAVSIAEDLTALHEQWMQQLGRLRSDSAARRLPAFLLGHPIVSVRQVAEGLSISAQAANVAIATLVEKRVLSMPDEKRWGRVFHATAILERLAQPPSGALAR
ncbi:MAG TPA: Fic/DOC family N-terminal domain-containing protein [Stenotrophomonas sp.]|nr:Fic/DOC family N-terminal domain-containing protein [Stenotrophomonas sp.]